MLFIRSFEKIYVPLFVSFIPCLLIYPSFGFKGASQAVNLCLNTIIPSLFAFMVVAETVIGMSAGLKFPFCPASKLLKVEQCTEAAIVLSFLGGYPIGVRCIDTLYKNRLISKGNARRLALCLVNPSPSFIITAIGLRLLSSVKAGIILAVSVYSANIIVSLGLVFFKDLYGFSRGIITPKKEANKINSTVSGVFVDSVRSCSVAMLYICMFTVFFGTVKGIFSAFIKNGAVLSVVGCLLEVTIGCKELTDHGILNLPLFAAALAFGGLCVMLQILCFGKDLGLSPVHYLVTRGISALIAFFIAKFLSVFYAPQVMVFGNSHEALSFESNYGFFSSLLVAAAAAVFILSTDKAIGRDKRLYNKMKL